MSAEQNIKLLCETVVHFNEEGLNKFQYSREDLYQQWTGNFITAMKQSANNMFSDKQSGQMANALINALKRVAIDTRATDEESKVQVIVNGLDMEKDFSDKNIKLDVEFGSTQEEIVAAITKAMVKKFNNLKLSKTTVFVVDCEYNEEADFWMPKNMQAFFDTLSASVMGSNQSA